MTNQLLVAQVLAEGAEVAQTSNVLPWAAWIPAVIGLLGSLIVAWWSGRKIDKQMEFSKQATPPELTRYKTWVEVSEKYKELMEFERANSFEGAEKEYQEIRASRKVALERAVWERKVISGCSNIQAQKLVMELPESKIYEIHNPDMYRGIKLSVDCYLKPKASDILWLIPPLISSLFPFLMAVISGGRPGDRIIAVIYLITACTILFPVFRHIAPNQRSGIFEANYFLRKKRVEILLKVRRLNGLDGCCGIFCKVDRYWEEWYRKEGLRYASVFESWAENIYCPWEGKCWIVRKWHKIWCYFIPQLYTKPVFKRKGNKKWGSYKEENLNIDLIQNKDI